MAATVTGNVLAIPMVVLALTAARRILKSAEDRFVICLEVTVSEETVTQTVAHGGTVAPSRNAYWDRGRVTITDPDGYRIILTERHWRPNTPLCAEPEGSSRP